MADACDSLRVRLRGLEAELKDSQPVPGERHPPKPPPNLNGLIRHIATTRDELNTCVESLMIRRWTVTGNTFLGAFAIDRAIKLFMFDHDIRALSGEGRRGDRHARLYVGYARLSDHTT